MKYLQTNSPLYGDWQAFIEVACRTKWNSKEELLELAIEDYVSIFETRPDSSLMESFEEWAEASHEIGCPNV